MGLRHVGIVVRDLERSLAFYRDQFGFQVIRDMDESGPFISAILGLPNAHVRTVKLAAPGDSVQIELLGFKVPSPETGSSPTLVRTGPTHIALTVHDLDSLYRSLQASGIAFTTPPLISPDGRAKVTFCRDPDGTALELVEVLMK